MSINIGVEFNISYDISSIKLSEKKGDEFHIELKLLMKKYKIWRIKDACWVPQNPGSFFYEGDDDE